MRVLCILKFYSRVRTTKINNPVRGLVVLLVMIMLSDNEHDHDKTTQLVELSVCAHKSGLVSQCLSSAQLRVS